MKKKNNQLVLTKEDYQILNAYLKDTKSKMVFDQQNAEDLQAELKKARLVNEEEFPADAVRINSKVKIKAADKDGIMELTLVTPDEADIREKKISIMAPIGTALIGFRQGQDVEWQVPGGKKTFTILEVINA